MDIQELNEKIAHRKKVIRLLELRLQQRELQEARTGSNTEPEIVIDKQNLAEQIDSEKAELEKLEILKPNNAVSIAEAEYRVIVTETWDTPLGVPTPVGGARLDFARLRLGIDAERSRAIEREARVQLAEQAWRDIKLLGLAQLVAPMNDEQQLVVKTPLHGIPSDQGITVPPEEELRDIVTTDPMWTARKKWLPVARSIVWGELESMEESTRLFVLIRRTLRTMVRIMRLDYPTLIRLLLPWIRREAPCDLENLRNLLQLTAESELNPADFALLVSFMFRLETILKDKATYDRIFHAQFEKQIEVAIELDNLGL